MNTLTAPSTRRSQWWAVLAASALLLAGLWLAAAEDGGEPSAGAAPVPAAAVAPPVSVVQVSPATAQAQIRLLAEILPRWHTEVRAFVRGEVVQVADALRSGVRVERNQVLLQIQPSAYELQMAEAKNRLASAQVQLLHARREAQQARTDWQRSGLPGEPDSPLTLHTPQLQAAQAEVDAAQTQVRHAQTLLDYTQVKAPFAAVVVKPLVSPGESVEEGQALFEIMNTDELIMQVKLDEAQWRLLRADWRGALAELADLQGSPIGQARIEQDSGFVERAGRQRVLNLVVLAPTGGQYRNEALLPGVFVRLTLPGAIHENLLAVPESALTRDGFVWYVDDRNRLGRFVAQVVFSLDGYSYLHLPPELPVPVTVATLPLESYLPGKAVQPVVASAAARP